MKEILDEVQDRLDVAERRLDVLDDTNNIQLKSFNELSNGFVASKELSKKFIDTFEFMEQRLKNKDLEIEYLNTEIRTLKILIETINIKVGLTE